MKSADIVFVLLVMVAVWVGLLAVASWRQRQRNARAAESMFKGAGLALTGAPLGEHTLKGTLNDTRVEVRCRVSRPRPGARDDDSGPTVCLVELELHVPDLIVCPIKEVDRVMGPLPSVSRTPTGHAAFDEAFAVFASTSATESGSNYRGSPIIPSIAWARESVVERLMELGLLWIRVRDHRSEVAFEPSGPDDEVRAALTCANLARAVSGAPLVPVKEGPRMPVRGAAAPVAFALVGGLGGVFLGTVVGMPVAYLFDLPDTETLLWFIAAGSVPGCMLGTFAVIGEKRTP